nr:MAG TPA: hypothetical protein [Caudoviricetes sp.]
MIRESLHEKLNSIIPTYSVGFDVGTINQDCLILRKNIDLPAVSNSNAGWDNWTIEIYTKKSPLQIDRIINNIIEKLSALNVELVYGGGAEYFDTRYQAFASSIQIRTPKTFDMKNNN